MSIIYKGTKIANVTTLSGGTSSGITPSGTIEITENGLYDVKKYASANVNVESGGNSITIPQVNNVAFNDNIVSWDEPNIEELEQYNPNISYLVSVNSTELETKETSLNVADYLIDGSNTISIIVKATFNSNSVNEVVEYSKPKLLDVITTMNATLIDKMSETSAVSINNKAYIFGGSGSTYFNTIQQYDPISDTITTMNATLTDKMVSTSAVSIDNKAYILQEIYGGSGDLKKYATYASVHIGDKQIANGFIEDFTSGEATNLSGNTAKYRGNIWAYSSNNNGYVTAQNGELTMVSEKDAFLAFKLNGFIKNTTYTISFTITSSETNSAFSIYTSNVKAGTWTNSSRLTLLDGTAQIVLISKLDKNGNVYSYTFTPSENYDSLYFTFRNNGTIIFDSISVKI